MAQSSATQPDWWAAKQSLNTSEKGCQNDNGLRRIKHSLPYNQRYRTAASQLATNGAGALIGLPRYPRRAGRRSFRGFIDRFPKTA